MRMGLVDMVAFQHCQTEEHLRTEVAAGTEAVIFDGFEDAMLDETARLVWGCALKESTFAVGSSGLTHGLLRHWRRLGLIGSPGGTLRLNRPRAVDRLLVLSGSCSPLTARQIERSRQQGFSTLRLEGRSHRVCKRARHSTLWRRARA